MKQFLTKSDVETKQLAAKLAKEFNNGVIALSGGLGAGKTTFVQGFAKALGITEKIISPTFVLIRLHQIPNTEKTLYHIDLYRLEDFTGIGLEEIFNNPENLVLVEWAEKAKHLLPKNTTWINFESLENNQRKITIEGVLF